MREVKDNIFVGDEQDGQEAEDFDIIINVSFADTNNYDEKFELIDDDTSGEDREKQKKNYKKSIQTVLDNYDKKYSFIVQLSSHGQLVSLVPLWQK